MGWNGAVPETSHRPDEGPVHDPSTPEGRVVGVGPWPTGTPLPADAAEHPDRYDPELLAAGDTRNVADEFRYWRLEAIVAELDRRRFPFHVAVENWGHDFNIGSVVRSANAFGARAVHIVGRRRWNRRGAMVTDRYQHVHHHPDVEALVAWARGEDLPIVGIDNVPGSLPIEQASLPEACVLVFGEESAGLSAAMQQACETVLHITQYGSTRSINAGAAAAVAMHSWVLEHADGQPGPAEFRRAADW